MISMERDRIVLETIEWYTTHPRGVLPGTATCVYADEPDLRCAVGRCLTRPLDWAGFMGDVRDLARAISGPMDDPEEAFERALLPRYRGHGLDFWAALQVLHDDDKYWGPEGDGPTPAGWEYAKKIMVEP